MSTWQEDQDLIEEAIKQFPEEFALRAWPNDKFEIVKAACYVTGGQVMLYVYIKKDGDSRGFAKGTISELKREVIPFKS